jgi:hypothetical protein
VTRKTFITALGCALLATTMLGCGGSNKLQTINLTIGGDGGTFNLVGIGGTLQLKATGNYSSTKTKDLTNVVTYTIIVDPVNNTDAFGDPLLDPPQTMTLSATGLLTAVEPAVCTWVDVSSDPDKPSWAISGDYEITATFDGVTSQPVFVAVASAAGNPDFNGVNNNPQQLCGPSSN